MKYVVITLSVISIVLFMVCRFLFSEIGKLKEDNTTLRLNNEGLVTTIKEHNNGKMEASKTIVKIQEKIKYIKNDCDCYGDNLPDDILPLARGDL